MSRPTCTGNPSQSPGAGVSSTIVVAVAAAALAVHARVRGPRRYRAVLEVSAAPVPASEKLSVVLRSEVVDDWLTFRILRRPGSMSTNGPGPLCPWSYP